MPSVFNIQSVSLLKALLANRASAYSKSIAFSLMSIMLSAPLLSTEASAKPDECLTLLTDSGNASYIYCPILNDRSLAIRDDKMMAIASNDGQLITGFDYEMLLPATSFTWDKSKYEDDVDVHKLLLANKPDSGLGILDLEGREVIPMIYESIVVHGDDYICAGNDGTDTKWQCFDSQGNPRFSNAYSDGEMVFEQFFIVKKDDYYGLIDSNENIIIPYEYKQLDTFSDDNLLIAKKTINNQDGTEPYDAYGVLSTNNKVVTPFHYQHIYTFDKGETGTKSITSLDGKKGWINYKGDIILPAVYDRISTYDNHYAIITQGEKKGVTDPDGNIVLPVEYDWINDLYEDYGPYIVLKNDKKGVIDYHGSIIFPAIYDGIDCCYGNSYKQGYTRVNKGGLMGVVDNQHNILIPIKYDSISERSNGMHIVKLNDRAGIIDEKDNVIIPIEFEDIKHFDQGLAAAKQSDKWGFIDRTGQWIINNRYQDVNKIYYNQTVVKIDDKEGVINLDEQFIIEPEYSSLYFEESFYNYHAINYDSSMNRLEGIIDSTGSVVLPVIYEDVHQVKSDRFLVKQKDLWGLINSDQSNVIPIEHDEALLMGDHNIAMQKDNQWILYDMDGVRNSDVTFKQVNYLIDHLYTAQLSDGNWGIIDEQGVTVTPFSYKKEPWSYGKEHIRFTLDNGKDMTVELAELTGK